MVAANQDVDIPWREVDSFHGVVNARQFYETTLPAISQLHRQAIAHPSGSNELRTLRERVEALLADGVCDLGCGLGDWATVYGPAADRIHLVDLSPSILASAVEHVTYLAPAANVTCQVLDLFTETDWRSIGGFPVYLLAFVLGHGTQHQRVGALASLRRVVQSGERIVVMDSLKYHPRQNADTVRCVKVAGELVGAFKHFFERDELLALAHQAGFEVASSWWGRRYFMVELR